METLLVGSKKLTILQGHGRGSNPTSLSTIYVIPLNFGDKNSPWEK